MNGITWEQLTDWEREVLSVMPDEWTLTFSLPELVQLRMLSTTLPLALRGAVIETRGGEMDQSIEYRRTETGRALVQANTAVESEPDTDGGWHAPDSPLPGTPERAAFDTRMIAGQVAVELPIEELESEYVRLAVRVKQLEVALKPFADAAAEIPDGLRSTLRIWNGESDDDKYGVIGLSATTDHLLAAARALKAEDGT